MGCSIGFSSCRGGYSNAPAPNPDPKRWTLLAKYEYDYGYVLIVYYHDCTNFEGRKLMVFRGKYVERAKLDPHFDDSKLCPVARFRPDEEGLEWAKSLARSFVK